MIYYTLKCQASQRFASVERDTNKKPVPVSDTSKKPVPVGSSILLTRRPSKSSFPAREVEKPSTFQTKFQESLAQSRSKYWRSQYQTISQCQTMYRRQYLDVLEPCWHFEPTGWTNLLRTTCSDLSSSHDCSTHHLRGRASQMLRWTPHFWVIVPKI